MGRLTDRLQRLSFTRRSIGLFFLVVFFFGCAGYVIKGDRPKGVYHRIKKGETLWSIARAYQVQVQDIAEVNNIDKPALIEADTVLFIPQAKQVIDDVMSSIITQKNAKADANAGRKAGRKEAGGKESLGVGAQAAGIGARADKTLSGDAGETARDVKSAEGNSPPAVGEDEDGERQPVPSVQEAGKNATGVTARQTTSAKRSDELQFDRKRFIWPVKGNIESRFGIQPNGMFYNGIRIRGKEGQPVIASDSGTIIFSSSIKDYGETIIIKHADNYATVYTNLGSRVVKTDERVKKGDEIARLAKEDKVTGASMNFEIRERNKARNPLFFLP